MPLRIAIDPSMRPAEPIGLSYGTLQSVNEACTKWLRKRGLMYSDRRRIQFGRKRK